MADHRKIAGKINRHITQLATEGIYYVPAIIDRMKCHDSEFRQIRDGTTKKELTSLSNEFPGFHYYASLMEEAPLPNDGGTPEFSELHKKLMNDIFTTAAALRCEFLLIFYGAKLSIEYKEAADLSTQYQRWLNDVEFFRKSFQADAKVKTQVDFINKVFAPVVKRLCVLAKRVVEKGDQLKQGASSPFTIPSEVATSSYRCHHCGQDIALLIYGDHASNLAGLEAYAQLMENKIKETNLPSYVLAPPIDPDSEDDPALLLKVHPSIEEPYLITPDEWLNLIAKMSDAHCKPSNASIAS